MKKSKWIVSKILEEKEINSPGGTKKDPKLLDIKARADDISTKADLARAKNQLLKTKVDKKRIILQYKKLKDEEEQYQISEEERNQTDQSDIKVKTVHRKPDDIDLDSSKVDINKPEESQPEQEESLLEADDDEEEDIDSEVPTGDEDEEDENEKDMSELPDDAKDGDEEEQPEDVDIAGEKPQSKEEAEIAQIQARTREIQSKIGEYGAGGAQGGDDSMSEDPNMTDGDSGEVAGANMEGDPSAMGEGEIDPMTGMPKAKPEKPDPLKGFGDSTDPAAAGAMGGMGNVDPMTGQPIETGPSKSTSALGRLYLMKKIYNRLALLNSILVNCSDEEINDLRAEVNEAFEIFQMVTNNLKAFKDKIDDIIMNFYMFIQNSSKDLESHFKQKKMMSED